MTTIALAQTAGITIDQNIQLIMSENKIEDKPSSYHKIPWENGI